MLYPNLREFLATAAEKLAAKEVTLDDLNTVLDGFARGEAMDEHEKAMAERFEKLGMDDPNPHDGATPDFRRGFREGFVAGFQSSDDITVDPGTDRRYRRGWGDGFVAGFDAANAPANDNAATPPANDDGTFVCVCGHVAGHHDDEPVGCWDCDCTGWSEADAAKPVNAEPARPAWFIEDGNFYNLTEAQTSRLPGVTDSYDWCHIFQSYAAGNHVRTREAFTCSINDVAAVIHLVDGDNDGPDWVGVFKLNDGRFLTIRAGCDYTGWGCQESGSSNVADTLEDAVTLGLTSEERERLGVK